MQITEMSEDDLDLLYGVIDAASEEASGRDIDLSVTDLTFRLFAAFAAGEREHNKLVDAVLFPPHHTVH